MERGWKLTFVTLRLTSREGLPNLSDTRTVTVEVQDGTLPGFGSANPCSEAPYNGAVCSTYQGAVMAVFRGPVRARFTAEGLPALERNI